MTQEEKELLLKDLCTRLPYGVIMNTPNGDGHLCSINQTIFGNEYGINISATRRDYFNDEKLNFKPYLRPMSSMTEEEFDKYEELEWVGDFEHLSLPLLDWLNKKMFAYRTIDGKDMFELDLAIKAPEGMYNINLM